MTTSSIPGPARTVARQSRSHGPARRRGVPGRTDRRRRQGQPDHRARPPGAGHHGTDGVAAIASGSARRDARAPPPSTGVASPFECIAAGERHRRSPALSGLERRHGVFRFALGSVSPPADVTDQPQGHCHRAVHLQRRHLSRLPCRVASNRIHGGAFGDGVIDGGQGETSAPVR
jgi:hypothetical protein